MRSGVDVKGREGQNVMEEKLYEGGKVFRVYSSGGLAQCGDSFARSMNGIRSSQLTHSHCIDTMEIGCVHIRKGIK
jgi:hypothetical protein